MTTHIALILYRDLVDKINKYEQILCEMKSKHNVALEACTPLSFKHIWMKNTGKTGGRIEWMPYINKLVLKMLVNRTPPSCIQKNILATARVVSPTYNIRSPIPEIHPKEPDCPVAGHKNSCCISTQPQQRMVVVPYQRDQPAPPVACESDCERA